MSASAVERRFMSRWLPTAVSCNLLGIARCVGIAALLAVYAEASAQENYGRLFFSAEERRTLDDMRNDDLEPVQTVDPGVKTTVAPVVDVISFDGKVERSGGGTTVWVNGRPVLTGNRTVEGISVHSQRGTSAETRFVLPPSDTAETDFSLKVGQKIAVQSGKVLDSYENRAAEDAESVFAIEQPGDEATPPGDEKSPQGPGSSVSPAPPGGS
jgi:hypothetical protein